MAKRLTTKMLRRAAYILRTADPVTMLTLDPVQVARVRQLIREMAAKRKNRLLRRALASGSHPFAYSGDIDGEGPDGTWGDNRSIHERTYLPGKW